MAALGLRKSLRRLVGGGDDTFARTVAEMNAIAAANRRLVGTLGAAYPGDFPAHKTSDTLFVLGSGPSVNDMTDADFAAIGQADSIGFNFWMAHAFTPRFYMLQFPPGMTETVLALLDERRADYAGVPIIVRGSELGKEPEAAARALHGRFADNPLYFMNEFPIHSRCGVPVDALVDFVANLGLFEFGRPAPFTPKWRGTMGLLVSMGYQLGYRRIVLVGVDMTDPTHFYDAPAYAPLRARFDLPKPGENDILSMMSRRYAPNTVGDYVEVLARRMREAAGVELMIASERSALAGVLPLWRR